MAFGAGKFIAGQLLVLNFCMYVIVGAISGWALNKAIDHSYTSLGPLGYRPVYLSIGNEASGFFVIFALIASAVGAASCLHALHHLKSWTSHSLISTAASSFVAWGLTLLAMGLACKEINIGGRNAKLRTVESFLIILSGTQLLYLLVIHMGEVTEETYVTRTTMEPQKSPASRV